jgi:hypothetical protein
MTGKLYKTIGISMSITFAILSLTISCRTKKIVLQPTTAPTDNTSALQIAALQSENAALKGKLEAEIAQNKILLEEKIKLKTIDSSSKERSSIYFDSIVTATNKDFDAVAKAQQKDEQLMLSQKLNVNIKRNYNDVKIMSDILNLKYLCSI